MNLPWGRRSVVYISNVFSGFDRKKISEEVDSLNKEFKIEHEKTAYLWRHLAANENISEKFAENFFRFTFLKDDVAPTQQDLNKKFAGFRELFQNLESIPCMDASARLCLVLVVFYSDGSSARVIQANSTGPLSMSHIDEIVKKHLNRREMMALVRAVNILSRFTEEERNGIIKSLSLQVHVS
jgi:hypothetical protein